MSFGIQIFDESGKNLVENEGSVFYIDFFHAVNSGSKSYDLGPGEYLEAIIIDQFNPDSRRAATNFSVSGNTVYWNCYELAMGGIESYISVTKRGAL